MTPHVDEDGKPLKLSHMILEGSLTASHRCVYPLWPASQCLGIVQEKKKLKRKGTNISTKPRGNAFLALQLD